jgi:hypothetical protein
MGAQRVLRVGLLTFALMNAQPSYSLEWELVTEIEEKPLSNMPDNEVGHTVQHTNHNSVSESGTSYIKNEYSDGEKSQQDLQPQHFQNRLNGPITKNSLQKYDVIEDDFKVESPTEDIDRNIGLMRTRNTEKQAVENIEEEYTKETNTAIMPIISLQVEIGKHLGGNSHSEKNFEKPSNHKWELVQGSGIADTKTENTEITSTDIAWEAIPVGEEITLSEIKASINNQKRLKEKAEEKLERVVSRRSRIGWLSRLVNRLRPTNRSTDSTELDTDTASQEDLDLIATTIDNNINYLGIGQSIKPMDRASDETSIILEEVMNSDQNGTINIDSANDIIVKSSNTKPNSIESSPVLWNTKPLASAFQLIRIRF